MIKLKYKNTLLHKIMTKVSNKFKIKLCYENVWEVCKH